MNKFKQEADVHDFKVGDKVRLKEGGRVGVIFEDMGKGWYIVEEEDHSLYKTFTVRIEHYEQV